MSNFTVKPFPGRLLPSLHPLQKPSALWGQACFVDPQLPTTNE
nr:hypothetical protein [Hassalia byssoidea]